jgi:hypothetical protein
VSPPCAELLKRSTGVRQNEFCVCVSVRINKFIPLSNNDPRVSSRKCWNRFHCVWMIRKFSFQYPVQAMLLLLPPINSSIVNSSTSKHNPCPPTPNPPRYSHPPPFPPTLFTSPTFPPTLFTSPTCPSFTYTSSVK